MAGSRVTIAGKERDVHEALCTGISPPKMAPKNQLQALNLNGSSVSP